MGSCQPIDPYSSANNTVTTFLYFCRPRIPWKSFFVHGTQPNHSWVRGNKPERKITQFLGGSHRNTRNIQAAYVSVEVPIESPCAEARNNATGFRPTQTHIDLDLAVIDTKHWIHVLQWYRQHLVSMLFPKQRKTLCIHFHRRACSQRSVLVGHIRVWVEVCVEQGVFLDLPHTSRTPEDLHLRVG